MKKLVVLIVGILFCISAIAQQYVDVVYLKNGSIIRGVIIEQVLGESLKVQTSDGSVFVYNMSEVEKLTKEQVYQQPQYMGAAVNNGNQWQFDPNGELAWKDGKLYMNGMQVPDQVACKLMGLELWDRYQEANNSYLSAEGMGTVSVAIGAIGVECLIDYLIWELDGFLYAGVVGTGLGLLMLIPSVIASGSSEKKINNIIKEHNYGPSYSSGTIEWGSSTKQYDLAMNPERLLPSYTPIFSFKYNF